MFRHDKEIQPRSPLLSACECGYRCVAQRLISEAEKTGKFLEIDPLSLLWFQIITFDEHGSLDSTQSVPDLLLRPNTELSLKEILETEINLSGSRMHQDLMEMMIRFLEDYPKYVRQMIIGDPIFAVQIEKREGMILSQLLKKAKFLKSLQINGSLLKHNYRALIDVPCLTHLLINGFPEWGLGHIINFIRGSFSIQYLKTDFPENCNESDIDSLRNAILQNSSIEFIGKRFPLKQDPIQKSLGEMICEHMKINQQLNKNQNMRKEVMNLFNNPLASTKDNRVTKI
eukprot:gb/GECH01010915.1/.p1 GENE.gb/GECH01010915.1/~~gb/GECH01010915.1/.p1  ORF type:complete len:286 (+),score=77.45 gb/GECH01010915.1/:1-858(+)